MDIFFTRKTLQGQCSCVTMNGRCKTMDDNQYYQVFVNDAYFFKVYPMDSKINYGGALKTVLSIF